MSAGDIQFSTHEDVLVARLSGEVDMSNAPEMVSAIGNTATNDMSGVVLDLSEVEYLDSAGIHLLFTLRENFRARGQSMRLVVGADSPVNDALRLAGVSGLMPTSPDLSEALRELGIEESASPS
jgi:anti-sigma B factor antagonist/stage II sporulation protein AA (anti-sigma F factor antagonist)